MADMVTISAAVFDRMILLCVVHASVYFRSHGPLFPHGNIPCARRHVTLFSPPWKSRDAPTNLCLFPYALPDLTKTLGEFIFASRVSTSTMGRFLRVNSPVAR